MKRVFKFKKGEIIDGTEDIYEIIHDMIMPENLNTSRCPKNIKITIIKE